MQKKRARYIEGHISDICMPNLIFHIPNGIKFELEISCAIIRHGLTRGGCFLKVFENV
jgi:hypothetical protein